MNTKTPECWSSDPNAHGIRIELSSEGSLLLPFDQFAFAELKSEGEETTPSIGLRHAGGFDSRQRLATNRDDHATNGIVLPRRAAQQSAETHVGRTAGDCRDCRNRDGFTTEARRKQAGSFTVMQMLVSIVSWQQEK